MELPLTGVAVTLEIVGLTLAGTVMVNPYVRVPSELPAASYVSMLTEADPDVAEGIAFNQLMEMV